MAVASQRSFYIRKILMLLVFTGTLLSCSAYFVPGLLETPLDTIFPSQTPGLIGWVKFSFLLVTLLAYASVEWLMRGPIIQLACTIIDQFTNEPPSIMSAYRSRGNDALLGIFQSLGEEEDVRQKVLVSILDNTSEAIINFDERGKILNLNNAAKDLFQYHTDFAVGQDIVKLIPEIADPIRNLKADQKHSSDLIAELACIRPGNFYASIKIRDVRFDDRIFYTALINDISEQVEMLNSLKKVTERDSLTGLFNRKYLLENLDTLFEQPQRQTAALLYIDLDNFKFSNDTLGHLAGDQLLQQVSTILTQYLDKDGLLARLGGDEFAMILKNSDAASAVAVANQIRLSISANHFLYGGKTIDLGCSIGIAMMNEGVRRTEDILAKADYACHVAKTKGRNMVHLYRNEDRRDVAAIYADMGWTRIIKRALEYDRFFLVSQPIVESASKQTFAHEVLIRLNDQNSTIAMPNGFIPAAERFGLMPEIDRWVISRTLSYLQEDVIQGRSSRYSINLSAATINDQSILEYVHYLLEYSGVSASRLIFEITETMAISHLESTRKTLEGLRTMGCQTALDDFGAGHASYLYLKDLPVDYVKIDGSFVKDLLKEPLHMAMVRSMKEVADAVGIYTIAEYVEDEATMTVLTEIGIDYLQGYYLGRPKPIATQRHAGGKVERPG